MDQTGLDVVVESPAFAAGLAPTMKLITINGYMWTITVAREAISQAENDAQPLDLLVAEEDLVRTVQVNYHDELRYPHRICDDSQPIS